MYLSLTSTPPPKYCEDLLCAHTQAHRRTHTHARTHTHVHLCLPMLFSSSWTWPAHTQAHTHTGPHTHRPTHTQAHTHTHTCAYLCYFHHECGHLCHVFLLQRLKLYAGSRHFLLKLTQLAEMLFHYWLVFQLWQREKLEEQLLRRWDEERKLQLRLRERKEEREKGRGREGREEKLRKIEM